MKILIPLAIILLVSQSGYAQLTQNVCPEIKVTGPAGITTIGDATSFDVELIGFNAASRLNYIWKVRGGAIEVGQGTSHISVRTKVPDDNPSSSVEVIASVMVDGLGKDCNAVASTSAAAAGFSDDVLIDTYGKLSWEEERGRLDVFFTGLQNYPGQVGVIVIETPEKTGFAPGRKKARRIFQRAKFRKFDGTRLIFRICLREDTVTKFYILRPEPDRWASDEDCRVFSRSEL